jgi:hypothetical protein
MQIFQGLCRGLCFNGFIFIRPARKRLAQKTLFEKEGGVKNAESLHEAK